MPRIHRKRKITEAMRKTEYKQIYRKLAEMLGSGSYPPGTMLPSENKLCRTLSISRTTVRKALAMLEEEQRIHRKAGLGTFSGPFRPSDSAATGPLNIGIDINLNNMHNYSGKILAETRNACLEHNHHLKILSRQELFDGNGIDAAIFTQLTPASYPTAQELARRMPVILFNRIPPQDDLSFVAVDYEATACRIVSRIIRGGYSRIGLVGGSSEPNHYAMYQRETGYRRAFEESNLPINENWIPRFSQERSFEVKAIADTIIREKLEVLFITSEFYFYPVTAAVELAAAVTEKYPYLVCFDDIRYSELFERYPVTCVDMPLHNMCRDAVLYLADAAQGGRRTVLRQIFPPHFICNERSLML